MTCNRIARFIRKPAISASLTWLSGCSSPAGREFRQEKVNAAAELGQMTFAPPSDKPASIIQAQEVLSRLDAFLLLQSDRAETDKDKLTAEMNKLILGLDSLAISETVEFGSDILAKISLFHQKAVSIAQEQSQEDLKGLWLQWSERLLLTRSGLQLFFSESRLNRFEQKIDQQKFADALTELPGLIPTIHPRHEARLISIMRSQSQNSDVTKALLHLLASSGAPLARLYIYQQFMANPSVEFALALAQSGLPRTSDLLGSNALLNQGPFAFTTRSESAEFPDIFSAIRGFQDRWKDLKSYLDTLEELPQRLQTARSFWKSMHEDVEKKLETLKLPAEQLSQLKSSILQSFHSGKKPEHMVYRRDGIAFQEGDIVLMQAGETGGLWETLTRSGALLSHMQMVTFDELGLPYSIEMNFGRLMLAPLDLNADRFVVVRLRGTSDPLRKRINESFKELSYKDVAYDFRFDGDNHDSLYCSELASAILQKSEAGVIPFGFSAASDRARELLRKSGIPAQTFFGQGSYLGSKNFTVLGERIYADPHDLIRGQMILSAFTAHLASAASVRLRSHPDSPTIFGLSTMAQTLSPELRRGLGPQPFVFTVLILDQLLRTIEGDVRNSRNSLTHPQSTDSSRLVTLKKTIAEALKLSIPSRLSAVFPTGAP